MRSRDNVKVYSKKLAMWKAYFSQLEESCLKSKLEAQKSKVRATKKVKTKDNNTMKGNK